MTLFRLIFSIVVLSPCRQMLGQIYQLRRGHFLHFQYIIDHHAITRENKVSELREQPEINCKLMEAMKPNPGKLGSS